MFKDLLFFEAIHPSQDSLKKIYDWKYHPDTLSSSFTKEAPSFTSFLKEYSTKFYSMAPLPPLWIICKEEKVGVLYFEKGFREKSVLLSIFLDPSSQNRKIGRETLKKVSFDLIQKGFDEIIAFVKPENEKAAKAFEAAGFSLNKKVEVPKYGQFFSANKYLYRSEKCPPPSTFIIGEIGSNFCLGDEEANLKLAKSMMEEACFAGCDAAKFQLFNPKGIYVPNAGKADYLNEDINDIFQRYALPPHFIPKLSEYANYLGIELMCSFFSIEDFEWVDPYVQKHKIASYEIRHVRLLELAAKSGKPLFLSTGASTLEDIQWAVDTFFANGGKEITLLQCTAQYPAGPDSLNLASISKLQEHFHLPVGLSDHSKHPLYAPIAAVSLGATTIEKHVTFHRKLPGPDHFFAIDFKELKDMCLAIRETEKILGVAKKEIMPQEEELAAFARRGLQAIQPIKAGDLFIEDQNIAILRPGDQRLGIHPKYLVDLQEKKAAQDIPLGYGIQLEDVIW